MAEEQRNEERTESEDWFDKIHRKLQEKGIRVPYDKDELKTTLTNLDQEKMDKVKSCLEGIGQSIVKMASDDPAQQMSGALDLVAAVTVFIPHVGPVISGVCLLISNVILAFGGKGEGTSIAAELEQVVEKVVGKYHDDDVKAEAAGIKFKLKVKQCIIFSSSFCQLYFDWNSVTTNLPLLIASDCYTFVLHHLLQLIIYNF